MNRKNWVATLEKLRLLSNLETARHKLIQIILVGQPELERKLRHKILRQLWQRVAVRATIWPLNRSESHAYIEHRLSKATVGRTRPVFTRAAVRHLVSSGQGNPRRLNVLCDRALVAGFNRKKRPVNFSAAWEASLASAGRPRWRHGVVRRAVVFVSTAIALAAILSYVFMSESGDPATELALAESEKDAEISRPVEDPS